MKKSVSETFCFFSLIAEPKPQKLLQRFVKCNFEEAMLRRTAENRFQRFKDGDFDVED